MRNPCRKRKFQTVKAQGGTKCTDVSGMNAIDFFNYYSSQETRKQGGTENDIQKSNANKPNAYAMRL